MDRQQILNANSELCDTICDHLNSEGHNAKKRSYLITFGDELKWTEQRVSLDVYIHSEIPNITITPHIIQSKIIIYVYKSRDRSYVMLNDPDWQGLILHKVQQFLRGKDE